MNSKTPKVALVHEYLLSWRGGEALLNAISELWPEAPIYTALYNSSAFKGTGAFKNVKVNLPSLTKSGFFNKIYKFLVPSLPLIFESFNLSEYDIVISSSAGFAKGVITNPNQLHISYIHTPPRFLYGYPTETSKREQWYWKPILKPLDSFLRVWDFTASQRPDFLLCNSNEVKARIKKFYKREAKVVYPFLSIKKEYENESAEAGDYYLVISGMSLYKNVDKAILACTKLKKNLKVAGCGKEFERFKELADQSQKEYGGNVDMLGFVSEKRKAALLKGCKALIYLVEDEDFGMTPLESMYFGKPAIVLKSGGFLETVRESYNGVFAELPTVDSLCEAIKRFESIEKKVNWNKNCKETAKKFTRERFQKEFKEFVEEKWNKFKVQSRD